MSIVGGDLTGLQYLTEVRMVFNPCSGGGSAGGTRRKVGRCRLTV